MALGVVTPYPVAASSMALGSMAAAIVGNYFSNK